MDKSVKIYLCKKGLKNKRVYLYILFDEVELY